MDKNDIDPFTYFLNSDRIEALKDTLSSKKTLDMILSAREGDQDALLFLVATGFKRIRAGYHINEELKGRDHEFLNLFLKRLLVLTKKEEGPLWTVDILDSNDKDQMDQLGIEFYSFAKNLSATGGEEENFSEEQETHPIIEEKGLFAYLSGIRPEYAQILSHMAHYTPSDEIVQEMELTSVDQLKSKIRGIRELVDGYFKQGSRDDEYLLSK